MMIERIRPEEPSRAPAMIRSLLSSTNPIATADEARVGVEERDDGGHVRAADRDHEQHAEEERQRDHEREQHPEVRPYDEADAGQQGDAEEAQVHEVLAGVGDRAGRDHFLELPGRHQAPGEGQVAEQHLGDDRDDAEGRELAVLEPQEVLGGAHEPRGEAAERVGERRPLRHGGERHPGERHADHRADDERKQDPAVARRSPGGAACRRPRGPCRGRPPRPRAGRSTGARAT